MECKAHKIAREQSEKDRRLLRKFLSVLFRNNIFLNDHREDDGASELSKAETHALADEFLKGKLK